MWVKICDYYCKRYGLMYLYKETETGSAYITVYENGQKIFTIRISDHRQKYGYRITTIKPSKKALKDKLLEKIRDYRRAKAMREREYTRKFMREKRC